MAGESFCVCREPEKLFDGLTDSFYCEICGKDIE